MGALMHAGKNDRKTEEEKDAGSLGQQYLTFLIGKEVFAIGIADIREIIEYREPTTVPMMPSFIRGVLNLRGRVVPVIDLLVRFGRESTAASRRTCIVILEVEHEDEQQYIGIVVDAVKAVLDIADADIESKYIGRLQFGQINLQIGSEQPNVSHRYLIPEYSPEWLSIAVRGANFRILNGRMMYEGGPERTGQAGQIDEARIREIVLQTIRDNPALIHRILNDYLQAQRQAQREENEIRQLETSFKDRITDIQVGPSPTQGPKDATITIFAFHDFECPHSKRGATTLESLLKQYDGKVRLVFKNRPQTFHQQAT